MRRGFRVSKHHQYDLFSAGRVIGRLSWQSDPRPAAGWYVKTALRAAERLSVDPAIDELARDGHSDGQTWSRNAALAATLSVPLALDAAERLLHRRPARPTGRFRRLRERARVEIYVTGLELRVLPYAFPELPLEAVSEVTVIAGRLAPEALDVVTRRIALLGGRVVAVFGEDAEPDAA